MAQGMNKLNEVLAALPEVRELLPSARSMPLPCGTRHSARF